MAKTYTLTFAQSINHAHPAPERTAFKCIGHDNHYRVWPNRESLAKSIRMQQRRAARQDDWRPVVKLADSEGW